MQTAGHKRGSVAKLLFAAAAWLSLTAQSYSPADLDEAFGRGTIVISASSGVCHRIEIWIAERPAQQRRGLMFVRDLPDEHGMLFVYPEPAIRSMWMKNTYIPLDMLFIRGDGGISSILRNTEPLSLRSLSSTEPVNYVLELNGGDVDLLGIVPGDRLVF
jgi:uncharacterized membrane protein (UPF0127 family)